MSRARARRGSPGQTSSLPGKEARQSRERPTHLATTTSLLPISTLSGTSAALPRAILVRPPTPTTPRPARATISCPLLRQPPSPSRPGRHARRGLLSPRRPIKPSPSLPSPLRKPASPDPFETLNHNLNRLNSPPPSTPTPARSQTAAKTPLPTAATATQTPAALQAQPLQPAGAVRDSDRTPPERAPTDTHTTPLSPPHTLTRPTTLLGALAPRRCDTASPTQAKRRYPAPRICLLPTPSPLTSFSTTSAPPPPPSHPHSVRSFSRLAWPLHSVGRRRPDQKSCPIASSV